MKSVSVILASLAAASQLLGGAYAHTPSRIAVAPNKVVRAPAKGSQSPSTAAVPDGMASQGCYNSKANMTNANLKSTTVSSGSCREYCLDKEFNLIALNGQNCYCGMAIPESDTMVNDNKCNYPCPAYPEEACGGIGEPSYYSIFNIGLTVDPPVYHEKSSSSSSSSTSESTASSSSTEAPAATTSAIEPTETSDSDKDNNTNVAGIAGGVVAGVVLAAAAIGGLFFFMRRRRNSELEEEQRRNAAVNAFISGSKPPGSSGSISMTDSRLDPVMAHRRLSDGSIADNEDYSRKILRVGLPISPRSDARLACNVLNPLLTPPRSPTREDSKAGCCSFLSMTTISRASPFAFLSHFPLIFPIYQYLTHILLFCYHHTSSPTVPLRFSTHKNPRLRHSRRFIFRVGMARPTALST